MKLVTLDFAASSIDTQPNATFGSRALAPFNLKSTVTIDKLVFVARRPDVPLAAMADVVLFVQIRHPGIENFGVVYMLCPACVEVGLHSIAVEIYLALAHGASAPLPVPIPESKGLFVSRLSVDLKAYKARVASCDAF